MVAYTKHDLQFILDGILVSEEHASETNSTAGGTWTVADIENSRQILLDLIPNSLEPIGMRTISGELNNLVVGQENFGATGEFPRLLDPDFRNENDEAMQFGPPLGFNFVPFDPVINNVPLLDSGVPGVPLGYQIGINYLNQNDYTPNGANLTSDPRDIEPSDVVDGNPRIISNLIVDQSLDNPVAAFAAGYDPTTYDAGDDGIIGTGDDGGTENGSLVIDPDGVELNGDEFFFIPNAAPDEGLSAPFNSWMTLFGQFFDHGLDLVAKGGNGTVYIPLQPDDPLYVDGGSTNFMVLTRATLNENGETTNVTSPFVDQNQTYTSHPSHQLFVRAYEAGPDGPRSTGHLIEDRDITSAGDWASMTELGGMATWGAVKAQARDLLGIELTDAEALNIPMFAVDQYGEFLPGGNGLPQYVIEYVDDVSGDVVGTTLVEGMLPVDGGPVSVADAEAAAQLTAPAGATAAVSMTGFAFLVDIAVTADPNDGAGGLRTADTDGTIGHNLDQIGEDGLPMASGSAFYDNELLDAHFIAGDGRANENFGLTAVHHVFHQEHNRLVEHTMVQLLDGANNTDLGTVGDLDGSLAALDLLNGYLRTPLTATQESDLALLQSTDPTEAELLTFAEGLDWNGDRLFQAAKFGTEMQYQHLVFEEFGRKVQPLIDLFASYETSIDAAIVAEFAHTVYRFGHSMLTETVDVMDADGNLTEVGLIEAFLNPIGFHQDVMADGSVTSGAVQSSYDAAGAIARAMTRQQGNEIDEFVTEALRNNLLGLPLDLAAINLARGRETGIPSLNDARADFFEGTGDTKLRPYDSWIDFAQNLKHGGASIVNFIAAYGDHAALTADDVDTLEERRDVALALTLGGSATINAGIVGEERVFTADETDRLDFLNARGDYAGGTLGGLNNVDFWIGGLAEAIEPFGGMLGSTFNFVFEQQMEDLQDGDRFYYLGRTAGLNFLSQLEQNSFANMIIRNTDIGDAGADHLPGDIFADPTWILEMDQTRQVTGLGVDGRDDPTGDPGDNPFLDVGGNGLVIRANPDGSPGNYLQYTGGDHVVLGGTDDNDILIGGIGDDTIWGDGGDDDIEGGDGGDILLGGAGNDVITDIGGPNNLQGQEGHDAIFAGGGEALILGGSGQDFVLQGPDFAETFGGLGNDFIHAGTESNIVFGNEGNDWLEGGGGNNLLQGDNGDPFLNSSVAGHDVFISGLGDDDYDAEGGDDWMEGADGLQQFEGLNGFDWATYKDVPNGVNADMLLRVFDETPIPPSNVSVMDRFGSVEGLSGSDHNDVLRGDDEDRIFKETLDNGNNSILEGADRFQMVHGLRVGDNAHVDGDTSGLFNPIFGTDTLDWGDGNIILGGAGNDVMEGRGGDDIIDGDLKADMRLLVTDGAGTALATAYTMQGQLYAVDAGGNTVRDVDGNPVATTLGGFDNLDDAVFNRATHPGNIEIRRELIDLSDAGDFDTAQFSGNRDDYTIDLTPNAQGFITITDNVGTDGTDLVRNVQRLVFADQTIDLEPGLNTPATGQPEILDHVSGDPVTSVAVGQQLRATMGTIADADGIAADAIITYIWQFEEEPGSGTFTDFIIINGSGEDGPLEGEVIEVPATIEGVALEGVALRVRAEFRDADGVLENVASAATGAVGGDVPGVTINLGAGPQTFVGTAGADTINGQGGADNIDGAGGNDIITGGNAGDTIAGGTGNDTIEGNAGNDTITGDDGDDIIEGNGGADIIDGGAGDDMIEGNGGADTISGNEGDDIINAGGGLDTIEWRVGDGRDQIDGGNNGADLFAIRGDDTLEAWQIVSVADVGNPAVDAFNAANPTPAGTEIALVRNGVIFADLTNVEELEIDTRGGGDTVGIIGSFDLTSLAINTITINGSGDDETIDISALDSAHRIVLRTNGGDDMIVGTLRPQDVIEVAPGLTPADYDDPVYNGDNTWTMTQTGGGHSVTYVGGPTMPPPTVSESTAPTGGTGGGSTGGGSNGGTGGGTSPTTPMHLVGTEQADGMIGYAGDDTLLGLGDDDILVAGAGNDIVGGGGGSDQVVSGAGNDIILGNDGNDTLLGQAGDDFIEAGAGRDRIIAGDGDDMINGGADRDHIDAGAGDDTVYAELNDGSDVINAGDGVDTYDLSIIEADIEVDLGNGPFGRVVSAETGVDVVTGFENITTGSGNDTITGNDAANVLVGGEGMDTFVFTSVEQADGDYIADFRPGDTIDVSGIASNYQFAGDGTFELLAEGTTSFSKAGQIIVREDNGALIVEGNVDDDLAADFAIRVTGKSDLNSDDFNGV